MDLRRNMFEPIKDQIREELGPLNPNWFEELTSKVSIGDGDDTVTEQTHLSTVISCSSFKTPLEKSALDSQLFSTPNVFRHCRQQSETEDEEPFPPEQETIEMTLPWTDTSPCLFGSSKDSMTITKPYRTRQPQHSIELLDTPKKSAALTAKRISESLGAQIDPDVSWTSSLNTPPDMTPTFILDKTEDSTCPGRLSADEQVILVRKLFPSVSNLFGGRGLSENNDEPLVQHNKISTGVNFHMPGLVKGSLSSQDASRKDSSSHWKQTLPDAIEDREICSTVANVLDGAEEVLSIFFSNSSSALRRVKTKDRIKRKQSSSKKEPAPTPTMISTLNNDESREIAGEDKRIRVTSVSLDIKSDKTGDIGTTQWTPISLADISDSGLDTFSHHRDSSKQTFLVQPNNSTVDQQLGGSTVETSQELTFTRKNRKFVYCAQNQHPSVTQKLCAETSLSGDNPNMKQRGSLPNEAVCNDFNKNTFNWKHESIQQEHATEENIVSPAPTRHPQDNDLDMSQLCRAFAQDLSQVVDSGEICSIKSETIQNEFSASACLSAMRQRSKKLLIRNKSGQKRETPHDSDSGFSNEKHIPTLQLSNRANMTKMEKTVCDSGYLSTFADVTQLTESSNLQWKSGNQPYSGFQTGYNRNISLPPQAIKKAKASLADFIEGNMADDVTFINEVKPVLTPNVFNLPHLSHSNQRCVDIQGPLTASQTADVTELCSLLEDADSQFEFTQFKPAKPNFNVPGDIPPHQSSDKELDPNFLTGIDFDDSFSSDIEKQSVKMVTPDKVGHGKIVGKASNTKVKLKVTSVCSSEKHEEDGPHSISRFISKNKAAISSGLLTNMTIKNNLLELNTSTSETEKSDNNGLKFGVGFKTAGGNALRVSEKCLSKARVLFADIEENQEMNTQRYVNSSDVEQVGPLAVRHGGNLDSNMEEINCIDGNTINNSEIGNGFVGSKSTANQNLSSKKKIRSCTSNTTYGFVKKLDLKLLPNEHTEQTNGLENCNVELSHAHEHSGGFQMANGKRVTISAKAIQVAKAVFEDCDVTEVRTSEQVDKVGVESEIGSDNIERNNCGFSTAQGKRHVSEKSHLMARTLLNDSNELKTDETNISHANYSLQNCCGFSTASGKTVAVSEGALLKATFILNESNELKNEHSEAKNKIRASLHTSLVQAPPQKYNGFKTASGKGVTISTKALNEAKAVFKDCDSNMGSAHVEEAKQEKSDAKPDDAHKYAEENYCAFEAAGGKKVHISEKDILGARTFLNESDSEAVSPTDSKRSLEASKSSHDQWKISGKGGSISINATKEAYFTDSRYPLLCEDDSGVKQLTTRPNNSDSDLNGTGNSCTFSTASGKTVCVSGRALQKAKSLLDEYAVIEHAKPENNNRVNLAKTSAHNAEAACSNPGVSRFGFSTASGSGVSVSDKSLKEAFEKFKDCDDTFPNENNDHQRPGEIPAPRMCDQLVKAGIPDNCEIIHTSGLTHQSSSRAHHKRSSLNFESLGLSGYTVTQQRYFAQEAMDCTKALLEDEDLGGQSPPGTSVETPMQAHPICGKEFSEMRKGIGKRSAEDEDMKEQPPLKRQLLAEFDRSVDCKRRSTLTSAKSSSDGTLKDRRVFKYNVSLQPNVTRPYRDKNSYMDLRLNKMEAQNIVSDSMPGDSKPANPKTEVFVPSFMKNVRTEIQKSSMPQDKLRTPGVYVPPFRKQNSVIKKSSPQPSNKNILHSLFETSDQTSTPVSLTDKNQSHVTESDYNDKVAIMKLDIEKVNSGNDGGQNLTVDPGGKDATAEGSTPGLSSDSTDIKQNLHCLQLACDMQDMRIRKKKRQTIRPLPGSLFLAKTSGVTRVSLRDAVSGKYPVQHTQKQLYGYGVQEHVSQISSENAESFRFHCQYFFKQEAFIDGGGVQLADGGWLITQNDGTVGKEEFYRALCDTPGVDPKLISEMWVYNHYRWIVWKQASMERSFPEVMGSLCLTPEQVLLQLKYRYDVEVDHTQRSALRKIMERDDTAAKTLVLCVCGIVTWGQNLTRQSRNETKTPQGADSKVEPSVGIIWLTDGWYAIKAQMDIPLTAMLHKGCLAIGGKVMIHGAELIGSQDACSPLEAPESLMLKIWANSTRRARWNAKLGFHSDPRPFLLPLSSLYSKGGLVGAVDIVVLRSYPTQWMEKKPGGGFVFRNVRAEEREARRHSDSMEMMFAKVQAQFEKEEDDGNKARDRRTLRHQDIETLQEGEELHEAVENDPIYLEALLSKQQIETLNSYRCSLGEKRQAELKERFCRALENIQDGEGNCPNREVTPVWKLCISDSRDQQSRTVYVLNFWRPSMDLQSLLKEGCRYRAYHLSTSEGKKQAGNASIQLTTTKKTQFQDIKASPEQLHFQARVSVSFHSLRNPEFHPLCGEVDLVGYVVSITDRQGSSPVVYLVDGKLDFVKVRFYSSLVQLSLEDLVKPLAMLALSNLQHRHQSYTLIPVLYAGDLSLFSANPKEPHLQDAFTQLRIITQGQEQFFRTAEERFSDLIQSDGLSSFSSPVLPPRTPGWKGEAKQGGRTNVTPQQPIRSVGFCTPMNRNPPKSASCLANKDPKSLKRKRGLDYLSCIPSPPPLCPLGIMTSPCVNKTFNPPRRSETPHSLKTVQTLAPGPVPRPVEDEWVNDEELATIDTQALHDGLHDQESRGGSM